MSLQPWDFVFLQKLDALEQEEEQREKAGLYDSSSSDDEDMKDLRKVAGK